MSQEVHIKNFKQNNYKKIFWSNRSKLGPKPLCCIPRWCYSICCRESFPSHIAKSSSGWVAWTVQHQLQACESTALKVPVFHLSTNIWNLSLMLISIIQKSVKTLLVCRPLIDQISSQLWSVPCMHVGAFVRVGACECLCVPCVCFVCGCVCV